MFFNFLFLVFALNNANASTQESFHSKWKSLVSIIAKQDAQPTVFEINQVHQLIDEMSINQLNQPM